MLIIDFELMKRQLYTLILIAGIAATAAAQKPSKPAKKYVGINVGYGIAGIMFQPDLKQTSYAGSYSGGLSFKYMAEKYMAFQAELNYTHRGYKKPEIGDSIYTRTYNSIMLPIMAQGNVSYKRVSVLLNLGAYASYMIDSKDQIKNKGITYKNDYDFFLKRDRRYEFGVLGGVGLGFKLDPITIQVESRYYYGLTNLYNPDYTNNRPYGSRLYQLQFSAAILYNLGSSTKNEPKLTKN
ncbi:outer membrane protein with beta-barrel domain [Acetobacteroides hydrogenigenes]|uniref:Outer membrane protein with beta-barrel domain n=2 Tax=Acetobacteroides hydrogenigenes TaxID=979970 RepID=A0A4R2EWA2_9BACT|nr:outer membrane protein with beta-barrel domain [Acetobacteroides hydrogenigenes]